MAQPSEMTTRQEIVPPQPEAQSMMDLVMRAAKDPSIDVSKMERLMQMAREMRQEDAKSAYIRALVALKPLLPVIDRKGRIVIHEKGTAKTDANIIQSTAYALWEDIDAKITPTLSEHGFALTFRSGVAQDGKITVTGVLGHRDGHSEETTITLPHDSSGSKNAVQAVGSSTSYGKRYTATLLLNIRTKGEDDDGKSGGDSAAISEDQAEHILEMLTRDKADVVGFCRYMKINSIIELPADQYKRACEVINTRSQKVKAKEKT